MAKKLPASIVAPGHPDYLALSAISRELEARAGGHGRLVADIPALLREVIDDVIQTPRTGRRSYADLEKTEKTYIGTRVEIMLRALLKLPRGRLDTVVAGYDTDIKHTMTGNWMIPSEAFGHPCILVAADEETARCSFGLIVARPEYLTAGANRDAKKSIAKAQYKHILWLFAEHPYPPNFWRTVPPDAIDRIFAGSSGNARMVALFREVQGMPISRETVEAVARQKDFMRRIRADGQRGTRNRLAAEGILLLSRTYDAPLIRRLGLPLGDFISFRPVTVDEREAACAAGWVL